MEFELNKYNVQTPYHPLHGVEWSKRTLKLSKNELDELCKELLEHNVANSEFISCGFKQCNYHKYLSIKWKCKLCLKDRETAVGNILRANSTKCKCSANKTKKRNVRVKRGMTINDVQSIVNEFYKDNIPILLNEFYVGSYRHYSGFWSKCKHSFDKIKLSSFVNKNYQCRQCAIESMRFSLFELYEHEFALLHYRNIEAKCCLDYVKSKDDKIRCRCLNIKNEIVCNFEWKATLSSLTNGNSGCPKCNKLSQGERTVNSILTKLNISFQQQFKLNVEDHHINKQYYYYDFYLPNYNVILEIDGIQHRKDTNYFEVNHQLQQQIDKEKDELAVKHGFTLFRIPYYGKSKTLIQQFEQSVENIMLQQILHKHQLRLTE